MTSLRKFSCLASSVQIKDTTNLSSAITFDLSSVTALRTLSVPDSSFTFVGTSLVQTLTNKSIDADQNTITNIDNTDIKAGAAIDATKIANGSISNAEFQQLNGITSSVVSVSDSQTLTNKSIDADQNTITNIDNADIKAGAAIDATKIADGSVSNAEFQQLDGLTSSAVGVSDTQTLTNKTFGNNLDMDSNKIINVATPTADSDAANKEYVDSVASGLDFKDSVVAATTDDLDSNTSIAGTITYNSTGGTSSRGQITAALSASNIFIIDDVAFSSLDNGKRVLIKNQINGEQNGIWTITISGASLTMDRADDFDEDDEVTAGAFCFVEQGVVNADSGFVLATNDPIIIGGASGTSLSFTQFSGAGQITAGDGLTKTGNTLDVGGSSTIIANINNIEVNSSGTANQVLLSSGTPGTASTYGALPLDNSDAVSGTLPFGNGGTGTSTFTTGNRVVITNSANDALETTNIDPDTIVLKVGSTVTTTDATQTTITTIPTTNDMTYFIDAVVLADNQGSAESAGFKLNYVFRNDAGTLVAVANDALCIADTGLEWDADMAVSGTDIIIRVTGEATKTINWRSCHEEVNV